MADFWTIDAADGEVEDLGAQVGPNAFSRVEVGSVGGQSQCGASMDQLTILIKNRLKPMQYWPDLLDGFIAGTGLVISDPE
ncbi:hypothetical protein ACQPYK_04250 [Streptosporangium sp. CA-135522]|uniref:hypothetical protein n=1 Tax=Streptosporangium sp. CA-135522 TaxID=3240072 RepID=UPI003D922414